MLLALGLAAPGAGAQQWPAPSGSASIVDTTVRLQANGLVDAEQISGDVVITTWERPEVRVRAWAEHGRVLGEFSTGRVRLRVEGERERSGNRRIGDSYFELTVPAGTRVRVRSVSGDVKVSGTRAEVDAQTVSGDLTVRETIGLTSASSVSGDVRVEQVRGDVSARSVSGDLAVRDVEGDVRASTVSGEVDLSGLRSRMVSAKSTSGEIDFTGSISDDGRYEFTSHSGDVTLNLPDDVRADMSVRTFSGEMESAFPVTLGGRSRTSTRSMDFTLGGGGGGARINVETFSGDVQLRRPGGRSRR